MADDTRSHPLVEGLNAASRLFRWGAWLAVALVFASGITVVGPDEVALRLRFGELTGETAADQVHPPGLLISFPYLIDEIVRVPVKRVRELKIDGLRASGALAFREVDITRDGYAITGDHNVIQPDVLLKYQIVDPVRWALRVADPEGVVRDAVTTSLVRTIAEMDVDAVLSERKRELAVAARTRAQARLDRDGQWVQLVRIEFVSLQPPPQIARYFADVQNASSDAKTKLENARAQAAEALARAESERDVLLAEAEGDALDDVATATGETKAFLALLGEYRRDPAVVWQRLYREGVREILSRIGARHVVSGESAWNLAIGRPDDVDEPRRDG